VSESHHIPGRLPFLYSIIMTPLHVVTRKDCLCKGRHADHQYLRTLFQGFSHEVGPCWPLYSSSHHEWAFEPRDVARSIYAFGAFVSFRSLTETDHRNILVGIPRGQTFSKHRSDHTVSYYILLLVVGICGAYQNMFSP